MEDFTILNLTTSLYFRACFIRVVLVQLTTEFFGEMMGDSVQPKDVFLAFTVDQGGNVVNACNNLGVEVLKCNAHRLNSVTMWALGINGSVKTCENPSMGKLMKRLAAVVGVFSHSAVNNDELKDIQRLQAEFQIIYELMRRNDTRLGVRSVVYVLYFVYCLLACMFFVFVHQWYPAPKPRRILISNF